MSYAAAVDRLLALTPELSPTAPRRKFSLEHMRILARALGDPQTRFPSILIAGTNGKGSTAATLASILTAAGLRTGLYTSPHLTRITERIRTSAVLRSPFSVLRSETAVAPPSTDNEQRSTVNGLLEIPEESFARLYFQVDDAANRLVTSGQLPHHPSFFETITALAFLYFAEQHLDIAVLEVGLGGRLDATNIVEPLLSVITDIALDHQDYLGSTIAEIAREKAGILRAGGTLITLPQHPEANHAIGEAAIALNVRAISATPYLPNRDALNDPVILSEARSAQSKDLPPGSHRQYLPHLSASSSCATPLPPNHYTLHLGEETLHVHSPLPGSHQRRNLALAIAAALELRNHLQPATCNLQLATIELGIANTHWPGRLEFLPPNLLLDVAHNPAGAWAFRAAISSLPESPRTLIFSCLRDKDLTEISRILFPLFDSTANVLRSPFSVDRSTTPGAPTSSTNNEKRTTFNLVLTPIANPRAASLESLVAAARVLDIPAHIANSPTEALALARALTPANGLILATGSIFLIGALRSAALPAS
ncbi:MAG: bifunctional folylpolyglutamate synthase/dihydrofolate synthase [Acidobacteriaceae bacterium]|jgi:dihydrofolate synthase/folylpolyglutamate synthase